MNLNSRRCLQLLVATWSIAWAPRRRRSDPDARDDNPLAAQVIGVSSEKRKPKLPYIKGDACAWLDAKT
jgi:hypothetical protein